MQLGRIGGPMSPIEVSSYIRDADAGRMAGLMDLANEAKQKDCHLQSVLATSEEAIAALDWELMLPESPKARERKAMEWVDAALRQNRGLSRLIAHHAGAAYYGYAVSEVMWRRVDGRLVPEDFRPVAHRRFCFAPDTGRLQWWDAVGTMTYPGVDFRGAWPDKFVVSQPRVTGDVAAREGLVRPLIWAALFRNWALADWLKLAEMAWKPWRVGRHDDTADQADIDDLQALLEQMTSNGVATIPKSVELDVKWPGGAGATTTGQHGEMFSVLGREMSKAVLGQTETTEASKSSGYAQAKVHNEVRMDLKEARARFVSDDIDRDVVAAMFRLNFGPTVRPSTFRLITESKADLVPFATGVKTLRDAGVRMGADWVRDQAGIPKPGKDEEVIGPSDDDAEPEEAKPSSAPAPADEPAEASSAG